MGKNYSLLIILFVISLYSAAQDTLVALKSVEIAAEKPVSAASSKFISAMDFENRPKNSAQDMLKLVPGLFIAQHAGGGKAEQIFIRGFDCDHGTDVATYVDGMPVNMPSHGHGQGYEDLHFLIPETVREMEIFKGPYSPKYGNFATGAAVNFTTIDTLAYNTIKLEETFLPRVSTLNVPRVLVMYKLPLQSEKFNSYIAGDLINDRGYFDAPQKFKRLNIFSKTVFSINETSKLKLTLSAFESSWNASGQIPERAVEDGAIDRFGSIDNSEGGTTARHNLNLMYVKRFTKGELEAQAYSFAYRFKLFSNFTFFLNDPVNGDEIEQDDNRRVSGMNVRYSFRHQLASMQNKFTVGLSYRGDRITNELWHVKDRERMEANARANIVEKNYSIYMNEVFRFSDFFRIETGVRFDHFNFDVTDLLPASMTHENYTGVNYQSTLNPKVNFNYTPKDHLQIFLNAGRGFHSNDARSVVQDKKNHELPKADGAEVGTVMSLSSRLVISAALWWMDVSSELVFVGDDGTTEAKGPSRRSGVDLSARYQLTKNIFADADVNISRGRFITKLYGKELATDALIPLAPTFTSCGGLTYKYKNAEASFRYRFIADRPANEDNSIVAKGYTICDAMVGMNWKKVKARLSVENIFNIDWNEAQFATESRLFNESAPVDELHFTPGMPVVLKASITINLHRP